LGGAQLHVHYLGTDYALTDLWLTCDHFVGKASLWVNHPGQLSLLPSVGWGMSSISVDRWVKLLAAVRPLANAHMKERQMWCICR